MKLSKKDDRYRTIMFRVYDDHRVDNYEEFRINPRFLGALEEIIERLESLEAQN